LISYEIIFDEMNGTKCSAEGWLNLRRPTRVPPKGSDLLILRSLELLQSVIRDSALPLTIDDAVGAGQMAVGTNWTLVQVLHALQTPEW